MAETPPVADMKIVKDNYFGKIIEDPYRYLEDFEQPDVQEWVKGQADFASESLHSLNGRQALMDRIAELDAGSPYTLFGITRLPNEDLFYFKQLASENVAKVYFRDGKSGEEHLLIDPESFPKQVAEDHYSISFYRVSPSESHLLYGFAASGSEQTTLKVFDIASKRHLPDTIDRLESDYTPPYWLPDGISFVYSRRHKVPADAPPTDGYKFTQAFQHQLGNDPESDQLVFAGDAVGSPPMAEMDFPSVIAPQGSNWVIGQVKHGDETDLTLYATPQESLGKSDVKWTKVCDRDDQVTNFAVRGDDVYLMTAQDAPQFKVVRTSLKHPDIASASLIVPSGKYVVKSIAIAEDALYVGILAGAISKILRIVDDRDTPMKTIELVGDEPSGSVVAAHPSISGILLSTSSWTRAGRLYHYDPHLEKLTDTGLTPTGKFDEPDSLTSTEVMVTSHDGVKVPLSIIHLKTIQLDGSNPTLLSGYGSYGFTSTMNYDPISLAWLERGGVLAIAHVRGGGAFGKAWHHAGRKRSKLNTWKDFIACAEHLVKAGYTSPQKLAGKGGSAGGILIGRAITERPDLFAAAQIAVGCTDMLRFETTTNGPPNVPEFGTVKKEEEFLGLLAMSTFHHIQDGVKYPAVILTHGINDPRVEPWLSAKTTARFQAASVSGKPILFRVDYHAGHGIGTTRKQRHEELADVWSFLLWQFGEPAFQQR